MARFSSVLQYMSHGKRKSVLRLSSEDYDQHVKTSVYQSYPPLCLATEQPAEALIRNWGSLSPQSKDTISPLYITISL